MKQIKNNQITQPFNLKAYYQQLDAESDPLAKILLKKAYNEYVESLSIVEKAALERQQTDYFAERNNYYRQVIEQAKKDLETIQA